MVNGSAKERELVRELHAKEGWTALRAPSSGSATDRDLPDVLAGSRGRMLAIELKSSSGQPIYIDQGEVDALVRFARQFGAQPYVACRWSSRSLRDSTFYFCEPAAMYRTEGGNYRAKYEDMATWTPLEQVTRP